MRRMKLCFVMPRSYHMFRPGLGIPHGGAEMNLYYLAKCFAEDPAYEVSFIVGDYGQPPSEQVDKVRLYRARYLDDQTRGMGLVARLLHGLVREFSMMALLHRIRADVVVNSTASPTLARIVFHVHGLMRHKVLFRLALDTDADMGYLDRMGKRTAGRLYEFGLRHADAIVTQTNHQHDLLLKATGLESTVVNNAFYLDDLTREVHKDGSILWVARTDDLKRPMLFLDLVRAMPEESFVMVMPGEGALKDQVVREAETLGNLRFIDFIPPEAIMETYRKAKAFVNTSSFEGFPNTFIQACQAGTPILSFHVDPDGMLAKWDLGVCCHDDIDRAIAFIRSLDALRLAHYRQTTRAYVLERHDIYSARTAYARIFKKLLEVRD